MSILRDIDVAHVLLLSDVVMTNERRVFRVLTNERQ